MFTILFLIYIILYQYIIYTHLYIYKKYNMIMNIYILYTLVFQEADTKN